MKTRHEDPSSPDPRMSPEQCAYVKCMFRCRDNYNDVSDSVCVILRGTISLWDNLLVFLHRTISYVALRGSIAYVALRGMMSHVSLRGTISCCEDDAPVRVGGVGTADPSGPP